MDYKVVIQAVVKEYGRCRGQQYRIVRWPDEEIGTRRLAKTPREIDAYAESSSGTPLAIEHTQLQTLCGQLEDNALFGNYYGKLQAELENAFDSHLVLVLPMFAFQKGTNWRAVRDIVREWLLANADSLPEKFSYHTIPGVPFEVVISKDSTMVKKFYVARRAPSDDDVRIEAVIAMSDALRDKNEQLSKYRSEGARTIVVLESSDVALASEGNIYKAFLQAHAIVPTPNIDEFWVAQTHESLCPVYCLLGPEEIMECVNHPNFMWGPQHAKHWAAAIKRDSQRIGRNDQGEYVRLKDRAP